MTIVNLFIIVYLCIGLGLGGIVLWMILESLTDTWVENGDANPDSEDSVRERELTQQHTRRILAGAPAKTPKGAAIIYAVFTVLAWPQVVVMIAKNSRRHR